MHACFLNCFSCIQLFVTLWTIACQAPLTGILQARILAWVAISSSRGSFQPSLLCLLHWQVGYLPLAPSRKPTPYGIHLPDHLNLTPNLHPIPKGASWIKLPSIAVVHTWRFSSSGKTLFKVGLHTKLTRMTLQNITQTHTSQQLHSLSSWSI